MKDGQFIRLISSSQTEIDTFISNHEFIYRYLPIERLLDILQNKHIVFVNPKKWNDPFDNFLFRQLTEDEIKGTFLNSIYCLCFTLNPHSQAYWKTYSPDGYGARLKIKTSVILNLLQGLNDRIWLGKMKYMLERTLIEELQNTNGLRDSLAFSEPNDTFLKVFHYKRKPFEYENEARLLIQTKPLKSGLRKVKIEPQDLFQLITLDPRMGKAEELAMKTYMKGFGIKVIKSQLFTEKEIEIQ